MTIQARKLPLFDDVYYSYSLSLEGNVYQFDFLYLERIDDWVFTLKDSEQNTLLIGQRLTPNIPLIFSNRVGELTGYLTLVTKSGQDPSRIKGKKRDLKDFYELYYVFDDGA